MRLRTYYTIWAVWVLAFAALCFTRFGRTWPCFGIYVAGLILLMAVDGILKRHKALQ